MPCLPALLFSVVLLSPAAAQESLRTVAERSGYRDTSRHADVVAFCEQLAKQSPRAKFSDFGTSGEGRKLPLLVLSDPPVATPDEAIRAGKPVVLAFANIHAGEVDGKEAVLALARDLTADKDGLLKKLVVLVVPNLNPDGNEKIDPNNRPEQNGPAGGVGTRANASGLDLNRDFVKLESPEVRALVKLVTRWDPLLVVDCHTTNGSYHRYTLTFDGPRYPAADPRLIDATRDKILPEVQRRVKEATGFDTFAYGNFSADRTRWESYPATPRFGIQYLGLRGRVGLLSESYSYAPFADRVKASYSFVKAVFEYAAGHADELKALTADATKPRPRVALRTKAAPREGQQTVLGYEEVTRDGKRTRTDTPKDYKVEVVDRVEPTLEVDVPAAYLIPPGFPAAIETLQRHGVRVEEFREDVEVEAHEYTVAEVRKAERGFQKHSLVTLEVKPASARKTTAPAGSVLVRTAQPLGTLAAYLLEPQAEDGLAAWNFFDAALAAGNPYPVLRLADVPPVEVGEPRPLPEDRAGNKPFTLEVLLAGRGFGGGAPGPDEWLDGEHFLQTKQGKTYKVHARTGRAELFVDPDKVRQSLSALRGLPREPAEPGDRSGPPRRFRPQPMAVPLNRMNKERTQAVLEQGGELVLVHLDGRPAVRLTTSPPGKQYVTVSPDGRRAAFVRGGNLFVVDIEAKAEKPLTTDGGGDVLNAKADWVYEEEIFNRNGRAYWWSPDGSAIAFLQFDDKPVPRFTITDLAPNRGRPDSYPYPKVGDPNPTVQIGVVAAAGGDVRYLDLSGYPAKDTIVSRVGWVPETKAVFAYVQNRAQTWLDVVTWSDPDKPVKLFRETTKAWVEDLGEPHFLKDGSFLILSERTGWKHLYHYAADGKLVRPVTAGEWEVQSVLRVDESDGTVYLTGTKDRPTGSHLYRVKLADGDVERLTPAGGSHRVSLAPAGNLYVDRFTDEATPTRTVLAEVGGGTVRTLDTNPVYEREEYRFGKTERTRVPLKDGFELEAAITYPPDFDPAKTYPVWVLTYAGPHAPTVRDGWSPRTFEQVLAHHGIVVFRVDPRSASGKGAASAWACYKQLGVQELKDLEEAVGWICKNPWADAKRVGISGHSYGGFMTAYALTHSKAFAAGIAGAPVTDWRLYDTIYTERYMGLPDENKDGYDKSSVVRAAANLHGKLLLIHGLVDDNVHFQHTAQLVDALQRAGKEFELMVYPRSRHRIDGQHYTWLQVDFIRRSLGLGREPLPPPPPLPGPGGPGRGTRRSAME